LALLPRSGFVYVLEGRGVYKHKGGALSGWPPGEYVYLPQGAKDSVSASKKSRAVVIEKKYVLSSGVSAGAVIFGNEKTVASTALMGDEKAASAGANSGYKAEYDFAVNLMSYQPGRGAIDGRDSCDGAWAADAGGRAVSTGWATRGIQ